MNYPPITDLTHDEVELFRPLLAQAFQDVSHEELRGYVEEALAGMTADEISSFINSLKSVNWGNVASGALGGAIPGATAGTAFGPWGTAIGAGLGALAGGLTGILGGGGPQPAPAQRPSPRPAPQRPAAGPAPQPVQPGQAPAVPAAPPTTAPAAGGGPLPAAATSAIGALMRLLQDPQVVRLLLSQVMQQRGQTDIRLRDRRVNRKALINAFGALFDQLADEAERIDSGATPLDYLQDREGRFLVDPADRYARARRLIELVHEEGIAHRFDGRNVADLLSEAIVRPLAYHILRLSRFRAGVSNTSFFPFSSICHLSIQMDGLSGGIAVGTGFYVDRNRILTAGHNVHHRRFGRATRIVVTPGRNRSERPFGQFEIGPSKMVTHPRWSPNPTTADFDLAILKVTTAPPHGRFFLPATMPARVAENGVAVLGYAADRSAGVDPNDQNIDFDTIRASTAESFTYSLHTTGGTSGSPVIHVQGSDIQSIGVHSRAHSDTANQGCRLTNDKISWIRAQTDEGLAEPDRQVVFDYDPRDALVLTRTGADGRDDGGAPRGADSGYRRFEDDLESLVGQLASPRILDLSTDEEAALAELRELGVI